MYVIHMIFFVFDVMVIYGREHKVYFDELLLAGIVFCLSFFLGTFISIVLLPKVYLVIISQIIFISMLYLHNINLPTDVLKIFFISNAISIVIVLFIYLGYRISKRIVVKFSSVA